MQLFEGLRSRAGMKKYFSSRHALSRQNSRMKVSVRKVQCVSPMFKVASSVETSRGYVERNNDVRFNNVLHICLCVGACVHYLQASLRALPSIPIITAGLGEASRRINLSPVEYERIIAKNFDLSDACLFRYLPYRQYVDGIIRPSTPRTLLVAVLCATSSLHQASVST
jgi:hypothetical protein